MIELEGVSQSYGGSDLLTEVSLTLAPGSFHFLTGPSGSGKTTLLKLCYGELRPSTGRVTLFGQDVSDMTRDAVAAVRQRIGVVHQDCQFLDHLPLAENVALPLAVTGRGDGGAELKDLRAWVGLSGQARALPPQLSGGERQRVGIARAFMAEPSVLIADEPTASLDPQRADSVAELLAGASGRGIATIVVAHDTAALSRADRHLRMEDGRLIDVGG